jgi:phosphoesterase RecJ-like protein
VINELAKRFKGGGHPLAAGATIDSWETADQIIQELVALCKAS